MSNELRCESLAEGQSSPEYHFSTDLIDVPTHYDLLGEITLKLAGRGWTLITRPTHHNEGVELVARKGLIGPRCGIAVRFSELMTRPQMKYLLTQAAASILQHVERKEAC